MGTQWVPPSCSPATEGAAGMVSQPCFSRMVTQVCWEFLFFYFYFVIDGQGGLQTGVPPLPTPVQWAQRCLGDWGWCQGGCKGTVPCLWGSEREEIICGGRWRMCLELVHVCFIILPAGTSLGLCFISSMCLGFWWGWAFPGEGQGGVWVLNLGFFKTPSPRPVLTPTGKPELSRTVDSEWLSVCLQAGEQLSSRAKISLTPEHPPLGRNEKYLLLLCAELWTKVGTWSIELIQQEFNPTWTELDVTCGMRAVIENWGRRQTGRPYFKLVLIDPYNNFIQIWDSNILLTQLSCTCGILIPHCNFFLVGQSTTKPKKFGMWEKNQWNWNALSAPLAVQGGGYWYPNACPVFMMQIYSFFMKPKKLFSVLLHIHVTLLA